MSGSIYTPPAALEKAASGLGIADVLYVPAFLPSPVADRLFVQSITQAGWQRESLTLFGRERAVPRLTAWYGEAGTSYRYSGVERRAAPWPPFLRDLARDVAAAVGWRFNYVLMNRYRDGSDMLGWHADNEPDLGSMPVIATLSVGAERTLRLRGRRSGGSIGRTLAHGSLLLMWGRSQRDGQHCVPRTKKLVGERISFTFRRVLRQPQPKAAVERPEQASGQRCHSQRSSKLAAKKGGATTP